MTISVLYCVQSLYPVPAPTDDDAPTLIKLPAARLGAILGLRLVTAFVPWIAARAVRRVQISYGADTQLSSLRSPIGLVVRSCRQGAP